MNNWTLQQAINSCSLLLFVLDEEGNIVQFAGALAKQIQISPSVKGSNAFKVANFPCRRAHFKRAMKGQTFSINSTVGKHSYETEFSPLYDAGDKDKIIGIMGMTLDVTKSLQVEQFLDEERHKIFASQRLNSLATVTNGIAHEINNPLAIISGYAEQLRHLFETSPKEIPTERVNFVTGKIIDASRRCSRIIDSLKDFSRNGSDDPFDTECVGDLIDETLDLCSQRFKSCGIKLKVGAIEDNLHIECRRVQIVQVLYNLLNNALDACKYVDMPIVTVEVAELSSKIAISVTDNGPGIAESIKNKIFEPFFTTKEVGSGVGVGLSISKGVVEEHRGTLELSSNTFNTVFTITLPKVQSKRVAS